MCMGLPKSKYQGLGRVSGMLIENRTASKQNVKRTTLLTDNKKSDGERLVVGKKTFFKSRRK